MEKAIKVAKEFVEERREFFSKAEENILKLAKAFKKLLPDARIFIFGSYAKGKHDIYLSDIDVLVVSKKVKNKSMLYRAGIVSKAREKVKAGYIFQIHLVTPEEFEIYKKFIDVMKEVKV